METSKQTRRTSLVVLAFAALTCAAARAEYRCDAPQAPEDQRACDLAKEGNADALRQFIQRTAPIYGLYYYDYVKPADLDRWEAAQKHADTVVGDAR
ncbi:MAG: hypothetical protein JO133_13995 [Burkholderiaceae bacterium]|nr:hypothetical protein [Burkholderiaceae bacterium]